MIDQPEADQDWLLAHSIACEEDTELLHSDPHLVGQVTIKTNSAAAHGISIRHKPGVPAWAVAGFKALAAEQVYNYLKLGPQLGVWHAANDGHGWQLTVTYRQAEEYIEDVLPSRT